MREFFKPWRRRFGVVTLGLACVFASVWIRSASQGDRISVRHAPYLDIFYLNDGLLHWDQYIDPPIDELPLPLVGLYDIPSQWTTDPIDTWVSDSVWQSVSMDWKIDSGDFRIGKGRKLLAFDTKGRPIHSNVGSLVLHFWCVVLPLTMLSTWLLLSKPRPAKNRPGKPPEKLPQHDNRPLPSIV